MCCDSERLGPVNLGDGVNHVNLSTDVENSVATKMLGLCPYLFEMPRVPGELPSDRANAQVNSGSPGSPIHYAVPFSANTITRVSDPVPTEYPQEPRQCRCPSVDVNPLFVVGRRQLPSVLVSGGSAFEFRISRYQASVVFAGGAFTDGVWGLEKTCYRCCECCT